MLTPRSLLAIATAAAVAAVAGVAAFDLITSFESNPLFARDFKLGPAQRLVDGGTLYPADASGEYPYPPLWAMLVTPFVLLPELVAQYAAVVVCLAAMLAALLVVGVRDIRVLAIAACSEPVIWGGRVANVSAIVMLLVALAYRYSGLYAGPAVALKLYAWPLLVWVWFTRGRHDALNGLAVAGVLIFVPWLLIGFDGITRYPNVAVTIARNQTPDPYWLPGVVAALLVVLGFAGMWLRRRDSAGALAFSVLVMIAASPVLWSFYLATALVPLALRRPSFSLAWVVPLIPWWTTDQVAVFLTLGLLVWCGVGAPRLRLRAHGEHTATPPAPVGLDSTIGRDAWP